VLDAGLSDKKVKKAIFVSGKLYYELAQAISDSDARDIALIRIEQFYPFPKAEIKEVMTRYKSSQQWLWVQEEPENMGGWWFIDGRFRNRLDTRLNYIGRNASASPATGYPYVFKQDQERIVKDAVSGS
jgi:2-oxoglutarate dehydrogenase E1 component